MILIGVESPCLSRPNDQTCWILGACAMGLCSRKSHMRKGERMRKRKETVVSAGNLCFLERRSWIGWCREVCLTRLCGWKDEGPFAYNDGCFLRGISDHTPIGTEVDIAITYQLQHILHTCHQKQLRMVMALWTLSWVRGGPSFPCKQRRPPMERKSIQAW